MKRIILQLILLCSTAVICADNLQKIEQLPLPKTPSTYPSYLYLKMGGVPLVPNIGIGFRGRSMGKKIGHDINLSANYTFIPHVCPSVKYTLLFYGDTTRTANYFGIGIEGFAIIDGEDGIIVPNIELVWGQEREIVRYSQFGINLLPTVYFLGLAFSGVGFDKSFGQTGMIISGLSIASYTVAF